MASKLLVGADADGVVKVFVERAGKWVPVSAYGGQELWDEWLAVLDGLGADAGEMLVPAFSRDPQHQPRAK